MKRQVWCAVSVLIVGCTYFQPAPAGEPAVPDLAPPAREGSTADPGAACRDGTITSACFPRAPESLLFILDGRPVPLGPSAESRLLRNSLLGTVEGRVIEHFQVWAAGDSAALTQFGRRAAGGVFLLQTREAER